ncbi:hypothetical protein Tco_0698049 [Tanacetum coccineum]
MEESGILWKLTLCFPDLRVIVPVSNLIEALVVVKNGVPKMKGLFSFSLISKITKSIASESLMSFLQQAFRREFSSRVVGHDIHVGPLIDEGVHVLKVPYAARGSASREFLEKPEHFSHPTIDLLALLENDTFNVHGKSKSA